MISTSKRPEINFEIKCTGIRGYNPEFWNLQIDPMGLIGIWHIEDRIKNYIKIEKGEDSTVYITVSFSISLNTKHELNTNLNLCHKQYPYFLF